MLARSIKAPLIPTTAAPKIDLLCQIKGLGPAVVGFISHWTSLPTAFWVLAALVVLVPISVARITR